MKMEATQQNLLRIQDIIAEVKRQTISLERQVKRAEEYKAIRKEVKEIEIRFAIQEYAELSEKGETLRGYLKALREREVEISAQTAQKEALIEGMRLSGMEEEERLSSLQQEVFELGRSIQKMESEVEFFRREEGNLQKQEGQFLEEVRESLRIWRETRKERKRMGQVQNHLEEEHHESKEILKEWETLFNDFRATYQEISDQLEAEKGRLIDTLTQLTSFKNRQSHLEERKEDLQKRIRSHGKEFEEVRTGLSQLQETLVKIERERESNRSLHTMLQEEKERWEGEIDKLKEIFHTKQTERSSVEEGLRQNRSRFLSLKELQEKEGGPGEMEGDFRGRGRYLGTGSAI
jgi:chromosome segregation protein